jgi:predicted Zn-dependent protease
MRGAMLILVSIAACAWFALGVRQAHDTDAATSLLALGTSLSAATAQHVSSLLDGAHVLNPDRQVGVLRAQLDDARGNKAAAQRVLHQVVSAEPDNLLAWDWVARSATTSQTLRLAFGHLTYLLPPVRTGH